MVAVTKISGGVEMELTPCNRYDSCGRRAIYRDTPPRRFQHIPSWGIDVHPVYIPHRIVHEHCNAIRVATMPWGAGKRQFMHALMVTLATWAQFMAWNQVTTLFRCAWSTATTAVDEAVTYSFTHWGLPDSTHIGINEISRKQDHVYATNIRNQHHCMADLLLPKTVYIFA